VIHGKNSVFVRINLSGQKNAVSGIEKTRNLFYQQAGFAQMVWQNIPGSQSFEVVKPNPAHP
jgi:hypothetical protein